MGRVDGAIDLVGGDMHKAFELGGPRGFEQGEGAAEVGFKDRRGRVNAAIDVRFGGKVYDGVGLLFG